MSKGKKNKGGKEKMPATAKKQEFYNSGFPKNMKRNKFDMMINKRIKEARNKSGYSLAKVVMLLADRGLKTGVSTIQGYEAPEENINHRYPSLHMMLELANLYNCSIDYFFGLTEEYERPNGDLLEMLNKFTYTKWDGQKISHAQKEMIKEKVAEIMAL